VMDWAALPDRVFADLGLDREKLAEFARGLLGPAMLPGQAAYELARRTSFQAAPQAPKIIVYCEVEADVRRLVERWARYKEI